MVHQNLNLSLVEFQQNFRAESTNAMPIAGAICWAILGIASIWITPTLAANAALYIMGAILPLAFLIDKLRGRNLFTNGSNNPLNKLFFLSILSIGLTVPLIIAGAEFGETPELLTLGVAILAGLIWIPYGWASDDPVGVRHAVARTVGCYLAFGFALEEFKTTSICLVVVVSYIYSLIAMKKTGFSRN